MSCLSGSQTPTRILGLDVGERRVGVALSDPLGITAGRLTVLERRGASVDVAAIRKLVEQHHVQRIVVGLPLTLRGEHGVQAKRVESFVESLRRTLAVPIDLIDERLTTVQGERTLIAGGSSWRRRKQMIDQVAAQLILQQFLECHRRERTAHSTQQ